MGLGRNNIMRNKKYIGIFVCAFAFYCALPAVTITNQVRLTQNGTIQFEGSTLDNFETTLFAIDPFSDNSIFLQAGSGTIAFISDISGDGVFPAQNTIYVDASNSGTEDGTITFPFNTIVEALTASSALDIIRVSPGTYAEALTIPHDIFFDALGAIDLISINVSAGRVMGRIYKWEFHANGVIIHPDSDFTDNWDCIVFAHGVGATQSEEWSIGLYHSTYDAVADGIDYLTAGFDVISLYGIGQNPPLLKSTAVVLNNPRTNSFKNLKLERVGGGIALSFQTGAGSNTGNLQDITTNENIRLCLAQSTYDGFVHNVTANIITCESNSSSNPRLTNIRILDLVTGLQLRNFAGFAELIEGAVRLDDTIDGLIIVGDGALVSPVAGLDMSNGLLIVGRSSLGIAAGIDYLIKTRGLA